MIMTDELNYTGEMDYVLEHFDFEKCHKVMELLDWKWWHTGGVPIVDEMREFARGLIKDAINGMSQQQTVTKEYTLKCGGFSVTVDQEYPGQKVYISLRFILTSFDNHD